MTVKKTDFPVPMDIDKRKDHSGCHRSRSDCTKLAV